MDLPDGAGRVRVIAGRFHGHAGPARTHTPMDVWDIRLQQGHHTDLPVAEGRTLALVVLKGTVRINGGQPVGEAQLVTFDRSGEDVFVDADSDATVLLLSGEPIDEPVVGYGPFVMNSQAEIAQAVNDSQQRPLRPDRALIVRGRWPAPPGHRPLFPGDDHEYPANFNGARPVIDPDNAAMLLIDHQSGLFQTIGDMRSPRVRPRHRAGQDGHAGKDAGDHHCFPQGPNGPLIPEITTQPRMPGTWRARARSTHGTIRNSLPQ